MGHSDHVLGDVRNKIDASDAPLREARNRLALVRDVAVTFPGALRTYPSGSIAQHTMIHPVTDGDGGLVLGRRSYPELGPASPVFSGITSTTQKSAHSPPPPASCGRALL